MTAPAIGVRISQPNDATVVRPSEQNADGCCGTSPATTGPAVGAAGSCCCAISVWMYWLTS
jgi:hypothetical protein